ncbi:hypothetical protein OS493_032344 [Desmophyllum pertusum]|uniref:Fibronectin type-III domain-containing protein n=1 Tax=Desmophyllum pertusum TaxID=174260 RepID=A0A9X0CQG1_9CNID|nr:hypothetical protein OS493_032344 [Desmophyllum pertusum]
MLLPKQLNSTAVKVTWQVPLNPNGEIFYRLYYWQSSTGAVTKRLAYDGSLLEHVVVGIHEYVTYTFMLQAYNVKYSWSSAATNATETTHPAVPSEPVIVSVSTMTNYLEINWKLPTEPNGIIKSFHLCWTLVVMNNQSCIDFNGAAIWYRIPNLKAFSQYNVSLAASTSVGQGPPVTNVYSTDEGVPSEPRDLQALETRANLPFSSRGKNQRA